MNVSKTKMLAAPMALRRRVLGMRRDEDGGMIIFSLMMMVLILMMGGMAVDLMRFETTRAKLQSTLDRAVLAAADLDQTQSARVVCEDYFAKNDMLDFLDAEACPPNEGINYRIVTASATVDMPLLFADLPRIFMAPFSPGLSTLQVSGTSTAEERVTDVEVSLVLDVSTSMSRNSRIENLRPAAQEFVTTVLGTNTNAPEGLITISMVPYSAVVNPGQQIINTVDFENAVNRSHDYSSCLLFEDTHFNTTALNLNENYDHVAHFDPDWYSDDPKPIGYPWCHSHEDDLNAIVPVSTNEGLLHDAIEDLEPYGNTAIDLGVKWGVALLDPSTRPIISGLAGTIGSTVPGMASGRPEAFGQTDVVKVLVLMTDGENTYEYDLHDRFKYGDSYIWFNLDTPNQALQDVDRWEVSIQTDGVETPDDYWDDRFYWNYYSSSYRSNNKYPSGYANQAAYVAARQAGEGAIRTEGRGQTFTGLVHRASWQDLYATYTHNRVNNELLSRAYNHGEIPYSTGYAWHWDDDIDEWIEIYLPDYRDADYALNTSVVTSTEANDRLSDICAAARGEGIIIYTVAFEAPSGGRVALRECAGSDGRYFDVSGTDISDAFSIIATDIRALKLTQ